MKNKNLILIISTLLIVMGVVVSSIFTNYSSLIASLTTTITAIIGAVALFIQFKKDKQVNQAEFILEFGKEFYDTYNLARLQSKIEHAEEDKSIQLDSSDTDDIIHYLTWCEELANLVEQNVIKISQFENIFSYRFFLITNNKFVQETELVPYHFDWNGVYRLHYQWCKYKRKHGIRIQHEDQSLEKTSCYQEHIQN